MYVRHKSCCYFAYSFGYATQHNRPDIRSRYFSSGPSDGQASSSPLSSCCHRLYNRLRAVAQCERERVNVAADGDSPGVQRLPMLLVVLDNADAILLDTGGGTNGAERRENMDHNRFLFVQLRKALLHLVYAPVLFLLVSNTPGDTIKYFKPAILTATRTIPHPFIRVWNEPPVVPMIFPLSLRLVTTDIYMLHLGRPGSVNLI